MKRLLLMLAVVGLLAAPASADLKLANLQHMGTGTVGVHSPASGIYVDYKTVAVASDLIHVTFAFHWPYYTAVEAGYIGHNFVYDNSEVQIIGGGAAGPFVTGTWGTSFPPYLWPNPSSGTWTIGTLYEDVQGYWTNKVLIEGSGIYPFFQVDMHVKDVIPDSFLDAIVTNVFVVFLYSSASTGGPWWTGGNISVPAYGMGIIPEPASMTLLAGGLLAIGAGVWRRRR